MDVTPLIKDGSQIVQSYAGGQFKISGQIFKGAVIVMPERSFVWDAPDEIAALRLDHFSLIDACDVVLLGTGARFAFVPTVLKKALQAQGPVLESMDTGAACRTYNVLMAEGRRVAAALLPIA